MMKLSMIQIQTLIITMRIVIVAFIEFYEFNLGLPIVGDDRDDDHHSLAAHLNSFPDHHGVSISLDAAVDCFIQLFLIDHQVQGTNVII